MVTLLTCQDTTNVYGVSPVEIGFFRRCLDTAIADMSFGAIKIGVVADVAQVAAIAELVQARPDIPLVVDPVLRAAGGGTLAGDAVGQALRDQLFAHATVITPNAAEARLLCDGESELARCGERLSLTGGHALITGGDEDGAAVVNRGFVAGRLAHTYEWPRVPGVFHGSGCRSPARSRRAWPGRRHGARARPGPGLHLACDRTWLCRRPRPADTGSPALP